MAETDQTKFEMFSEDRMKQLRLEANAIERALFEFRTGREVPSDTYIWGRKLFTLQTGL